MPVIGYGTDELPAFFTRTSGLLVPHRADTPDEVAAIARMHWRSGQTGGLLVTCPIPEEHALAPELAESAIVAALREAEEQQVHGAGLTPFLLARVAELTGGDSVRANTALLRNNASLAAKIASSLAKFSTNTAILAILAILGNRQGSQVSTKMSLGAARRGEGSLLTSRLG